MPIEPVYQPDAEDEFIKSYSRIGNIDPFPTSYRKPSYAPIFQYESPIVSLFKLAGRIFNCPTHYVWVTPELDEDFRRITVKARMRARNAILPRSGGRLFIGKTSVSIHSKTITVHAMSNKDACISGFIFFKEIFYGKGLAFSNTTEKHRLQPYSMKIECIRPEHAKKLCMFLPTHPRYKATIREVEADEKAGIVFVRGITTTYKELTDILHSFQVTLRTSD